MNLYHAIEGGMKATFEQHFFKAQSQEKNDLSLELKTALALVTITCNTLLKLSIICLNQVWTQF